MKCTIYLLLLASLLLCVLSIQNAHATTTISIPTTTHFGSGSSCYLNFDAPQSFTSVYKSSDYWFFGDYGLRIQNGNLTVSKYFEIARYLTTLEYTVDAGTGITSITQIYCEDLGKPSSVSGESTWNYDSATKILTIAKIHSSLATILINWSSVTTAFRTNIYISIGFIALLPLLFGVVLTIGVVTGQELEKKYVAAFMMLCVGCGIGVIVIITTMGELIGL